MKYRLSVLTSLLCLGLLLSACSGDSDDDTDARVREISIGAQIIAVGEQRGVDLEFDFSSESIFSDDDSVAIVVLLPAGVSYVDGSGEVDGNFDDEDVNPQQTRCEDGSSILFFDLDDNDLGDAKDPSGGADGRLEFDIIGTDAVGEVNLEARADYNQSSASCALGIIPQASTVIAVAQL